MNQPAVLYVEDEENDVFLMQIGFERAGLTNPLKIVENGLDAVEYLGGSGRFSNRSEYPLPALVLLDLNLPRMSGFEVLAWIRQQPQFQDLPVVIFSASAQEGDVQRAFQLGATDFHVKPSDMSKLPVMLSCIRDRWLSAAA